MTVFQSKKGEKKGKEEMQFLDDKKELRMKNRELILQYKMPWVVSHLFCQSPRWPSSCHLFPDNLTLRHLNSFLWKLPLEASGCKQATSSLLKSSETPEMFAVIRRLIYFVWCHGHHGHLTLALEYGVTLVPVHADFWRCVNAWSRLATGRAQLEGFCVWL